MLRKVRVVEHFDKRWACLEVARSVVEGVVVPQILKNALDGLLELLFGEVGTLMSRYKLDCSFKLLGSYLFCLLGLSLFVSHLNNRLTNYISHQTLAQINILKQRVDIYLFHAESPAHIRRNAYFHHLAVNNS